MTSGHGHGHGHGHDHDHHGVQLNLLDEDHALWATDHVELIAAGVDIGSATSNVVLSRIELRRDSRELSGRFRVVARRTIYQSPVVLTPYVSSEDIDATALMDLLQGAYEQAGIGSDEVDVGAVILTGEAAVRRNASAIAQALAAAGGDFVCATAGHHLEAVMAAYGSGSVAVSQERSGRVLNVDIGGGTTKFSLIENGQLVQTAALQVGARLAAVDENNRVFRLESAGKRLSGGAGYAWKIGDVVAPEDFESVGQFCARSILGAIRGEPIPTQALWLTDPLLDVEGITAITFSGGVSEYIHERASGSYGDLGPSIGRALRGALAGLPSEVVEVGGGILATVLGASQFTVQVSGNTIFVSDPSRLPVRDLQVVPLRLTLGGLVAEDAICQEVAAQLRGLDTSEPLDRLAITLTWSGLPSYPRIRAVMEGIHRALRPIIRDGATVCIAIDSDIADIAGNIFFDGLGFDCLVVCVDGIDLRQFDYIDIGRQLEPSKTVPVTIKSLVFGDGQQGLPAARKICEGASDHAPSSGSPASSASLAALDASGKLGGNA